MKKSINSIGRTVGLALLSATAATNLQAADGRWNTDSDGLWSSATNWVGNIIADDAGSTAYFTNDITFPKIVTLDSPRTIGNLRFSDANLETASGWTLSNGDTTTNILTLSGGSTPIIHVDPINIDNGLDSTNDAIISLVLSGSQGFVKKGAGTLTLTGANTFTSSVQLDEGIVAIGNASALGSGNRAVNYNGGGIRVWNGGPTFANTNNVMTSASIVSSNGNYDSLTGPWTGSGTIYIHSNARLSPGGTGNAAASGHLFSGFVGTIDLTDSPTANETRINLGSGSALWDLSNIHLNTGSNGGRFSFRMTVAPGTVRIGALSGGPNTRLMSSENGSGTSLIWEIGYLNTSTVFEGTIQNRNGAAERVGHLTKVGTGTLTLTGSLTYTGNTTISNGVLALGPTATLTASPSVTVVNPNAMFDVSPAGSWQNTVARTFAGNGVITGAVEMTTGTISPGIAGPGRLTFAGDLTLDGSGGTTTNTFDVGASTNDMLIVNGDLNLVGVSVVRLVPTGIIIPNGTYTLIKYTGDLIGDTSNLQLDYPPQTGTLTLLVDAGAKEIRLQVSGVASAANLTWRGDGAGNAWDLTTPNWRNGANPSVFTSGDNVTFDDSGSNNVPIDLQIVATPGSFVVNATKDYVITSFSGGRIGGGADLVKTNTGKLTITTDNDYLGDTIVAGGTLQIGEGFGTGTLGAGSLTNNGTVIFNRGLDLTFSSDIAGSGSLVQAGFDTLTLSGNNTQTGNLVVSNGTLRTTSSAAAGAGSIVLAGGTYQPQAQVNNPISVVADSTLLSTGEILIGNVLSGTAGTLSVDSAGNGFRFAQTTSFTFGRPIMLQSGNARTIAFYNTGSTQTYTGEISGPGGIHRRAPSAGSANDDVGGHLVLSGANTFSGGVTLSEGNIGLGSSSVVDVDNVTILSSPLGTGTLTYNPPASTVAPFGWGAIYAVGGPRTIANPIVFASVNGDTTQEALTLDGAHALTFSGTITLDQTAFLSGIRVNTASAAMTGDIGGSGGLLKLGPGTLTLSGNNSYGGETVISGGTLLAQGASPTSYGNVTIASGGTLGGTGTINGVTTNQAGGSIAPGLASSVGTLSFASDLYISGNLSIDVNRSLAQSNDVISVSGTLLNSGSGIVTVNNLGPALAVGNRFVLFNKPLAGGNTMTVTGGGATWANNLATDGSITVTGLAPETPPTISSVTSSGGNLIFSGTNGTAGATYYVLTSTNVATPLAEWTRVATNVFGAGGSFSVTNAIVPSEPHRFYLLQVP